MSIQVAYVRSRASNDKHLFESSKRQAGTVTSAAIHSTLRSLAASLPEAGRRITSSQRNVAARDGRPICYQIHWRCNALRRKQGFETLKTLIRVGLIGMEEMKRKKETDHGRWLTDQLANRSEANRIRRARYRENKSVGDP